MRALHFIWSDKAGNKRSRDTLLTALPVQTTAVSRLIAATHVAVFLAVPAEKRYPAHLAGKESIAKLQEEGSYPLQNRRPFIRTLTYMPDTNNYDLHDPWGRGRDM
jgi:hypothetical protein